MTFIRFFLGTPPRFLGSLVLFGALVALGYLRPELLEQGLYNLFQAFFNAIAPFANTILVLAIAFIGFRVAMRGFSGGRR